MKVLIVEPGRVPYESTIKDDLKAEQEIVGGLIEPVYMEDGAIIICNEEGLLEPLPFNRLITHDSGEWRQHQIDDESTGIFGTFFVCCDGEENFTSLSLELMEKYKKKFAEAQKLFEVRPHKYSVVKYPATRVPINQRLGSPVTKDVPER